MIKDRPHRPDLVYVSHPLYFVTFATRDRKRIPSLGLRASLLFSNTLIQRLERYVIMPEHIHLLFGVAETSYSHLGPVV